LSTWINTWVGRGESCMYYPAKVVLSERLSETMYLKKLRLLSSGIKEPKPFQFVLVWVPGVDLLPMSVAGIHGNKLLLLVKERGEGTRALIRHEGFLGLMGFYGKGFEPWGYRRILFIAGGSGIASFFHLAGKARESGVGVDLVWGVKSSSELFDPRRILGDFNGEVFIATEDCGQGYCGRASSLAMELIRENPGEWDAVIASGPKGMLSEVCNLLGSHVNVDAYVNVEAYVKCGIGACGSCILKPHGLLLCRHGPVFKCSDVDGFLRGG